MSDDRKRPATGRPILVALSTLLLMLNGRTPAAADELLQSRPVQEIKRIYETEQSKLDAERKTRLTTMLDGYREACRKLLAEKTRTGNIAGMAVGRTGIRLFEDALAELEEKGDFELPENVRRELREMVDECRAKKAEILQEYETALADLEKRAQQRLKQVAVAAGRTGMTDAEAAELFQQLIGGAADAGATAEDPAPESAGQAVPGTNTAAEAAEDAAEAAPQVIDTSAAGTNWATVARIYVSVSGIEIVTVPVIDRTEREHKSVDPVSPLGQPYELTYEPVRRLAPGPGYSWRLKSLPGREAPSILSWPGPDNGWNLQLRVRPTRDVPSKHGVDLQVSFPGSESLPLLAEEGPGADADGPKVRMGIKTLPEGAFVYVDGRPYRDGKEFLKTPCVIPVTPGTHNLRLRLFGYKDAVIRNVEAQEGRIITWRFEKDPDVAQKTLRVSARSSWMSSGIDVDAGDVVIVRAQGEWSCASGGESVDADGYPNNEDFFRYYLNPRLSPRQLAGEPYGALLMRVGRDGTIVKIGTSAKVKVSEAGTLYFDINEADGISYRRDNKGSLTVTLRKMPSSWVP